MFKNQLLKKKEKECADLYGIYAPTMANCRFSRGLL